jgi:hypothetical protein
MYSTSTTMYIGAAISTQKSGKTLKPKLNIVSKAAIAPKPETRLHCFISCVFTKYFVSFSLMIF